MYESSAQDREVSTPAGYLIKIRADQKSCIVHIGNEPEIATGPRGSSMEQAIPHVLFIGTALQLDLPLGRIELVENRAGRLQVPYRLEGQTRRLSLSCASKSDRFPVQVQLYDTVKQFMSREGGGHPYRFMVLDESVPRIDMVTLKSRNPDARIVILKNEAIGPADRKQTEQSSPSNSARKPAELDHNRMRATDLLAGGMADHQSANAVFNARIFLRNLQLDRVKSLPGEFDMTAQEIDFVRTFLMIMIKNENNKAELAAVRAELLELDEIYRLSRWIVDDDQAQFETELEKGVAPSVARELLALITRKRERAEEKLRELRLWEWQYRLARLVRT